MFLSTQETAHRSNLVVYLATCSSVGSVGISNLISSLHCCWRKMCKRKLDSAMENAKYDSYHYTSLQSALVVAQFFLYERLCPTHRRWTSLNTILYRIEAGIFVVATLCRAQMHVPLKHGKRKAIRKFQWKLISKVMSENAECSGRHEVSSWQKICVKINDDIATNEVHMKFTISSFFTRFSCAQLTCIFRNVDLSKSSTIFVISCSTRCRCWSIVMLILTNFKLNFCFSD